MAALTIVRVLFCGQGMTNLVEVYDDGVEKAQADWLALVDCGGDHALAKTAIDAIVAKVAAHDKRLDCLVISHQDRDHLGLLTLLGPRLQKLGATIGKVFLGGICWKKGNRAIVDGFLTRLEYGGSEVRVDGPEASDYRAATTRAELKAVAQGHGTFVRRLITNVAFGSGAVRKNASSAVVVVENGTSAVLLPGDATLATMDAIDALPPGAKALLPRPVLGTSVPHHGALATAVENYEAHGEPARFGYRSVDAFVTYLSSKRAVASAGPYNRPFHPVEEVLVRFHDPLLLVEDHTYMAWSFNDGNRRKPDGWRTLSTDRELHCTVKSIGEVAGADPGLKTRTAKGGVVQKFVTGDVVFRMAPPGVVPPERVVEFVPRGTLDVAVSSPDDGVVYAPAP
ncbi:MAG TPA: hypothetical protein VFQ85_09550 [Mycobacteriales bacterium]|jgi:hypothetical protein|nr:hypothetical protein [Mycobacteriales bacterium]